MQSGPSTSQLPDVKLQNLSQKQQQIHQFAPITSNNSRKKGENAKKSKKSVAFSLPIINSMLVGTTVWLNLILALFPVFSKFLYERFAVPPFALLILAHIFTFSVAVPMLLDRIRYSIQEIRKITPTKLNKLKKSTRKRLNLPGFVCCIVWKFFFNKILPQIVFCLDIWLYLVLKCVRLGLQVYGSTQTNAEYILMLELLVPFFSGFLLEGMIFPFLNCVPRYEKKKLHPNFEEIVKETKHEIFQHQKNKQYSEKNEQEIQHKEGNVVVDLKTEEVAEEIISEDTILAKFQEIEKEIQKTAENLILSLEDSQDIQNFEEIEVQRVKGSFSMPKFPFLTEFKLHVLIITLICFIICIISFILIVISGNSFNIFKSNHFSILNFTFFINFDDLLHNSLILTRDDLIGLGCGVGSAVLMFIYFFISKTRLLRSQFFEAVHQSKIDSIKAHEKIKKTEENFKSSLQKQIDAKFPPENEQETLKVAQDDDDLPNFYENNPNLSTANSSLVRENLLENDEARANFEENDEDDDEEFQKLDHKKIINQTILEIVKELPNFKATGDNLYIAQTLLFPIFYLVPSFLIMKEDWSFITNLLAIVLCGLFGFICLTQATVFNLIMNNEFHPFVEVDPRKQRVCCRLLTVGRVEWVCMSLRLFVCHLLVCVMLGYVYHNLLQIISSIIFAFSIFVFYCFHRE